MADNNKIDISVVIPTLNEALTIGQCVAKASNAIRSIGLVGEVIICDSYSKDDTVKIALENGARVVYQPLKGYGNAYHKGIRDAQGEIIIIGDADNTYDFSDIEKFITPIREGVCEFVMGNRLNKTIEKGAMPWLHRYFGTPVMTWVLNLLFKTQITDCNCGMRSFTKEAYEKLNLKSPGWEFASEMVIKAGLIGIKIKEVDITLHKDAEGRIPHLNPWKAAWNNFKLMFMFSARYLFMIPGILFLGVGLGLFIPFLFLGEYGILWLGKVGLGNLAYISSGFMIVSGMQLLWFAVIMRVYTFYYRLNYMDNKTKFLFNSWLFRIETGTIISLICFFSGLILAFMVFFKWANLGFAADPHALKMVIFSSVLIFIGILNFFNYFVLNIIFDEIRYNQGTEGTISYRQ